MKKLLLNLINPVKLVKAFLYQRKQPKYDRASSDLELKLYAQILSNDMLHWGYFEDTEVLPENISIAGMEQAQWLYAEKIAEQLPPDCANVLDVGCGMGGLAQMLLQKGITPDLLTPNRKQKTYVQQKFPTLKVHHCRYEELATETRYDAVINAESLQYIELDKAFEKTATVLKEGGRWIITDYFRLHGEGKSKSGHLLDSFRAKIASHGWQIVAEKDITPHVLPTIRLVDLYASRFLLPLSGFGVAKLHAKNPFLWYLAQDSIAGIKGKIDREMSAVDPALFEKEKKYMMFVMERKCENVIMKNTKS